MKKGKNMKILIVGFLAFLLSACVNKMNEGGTEKSPRVIVAPLPENERKTLAIARFTNDSRQGNGSKNDEIEDKIGKQASAFLEHHLVITQRFNIMERQDIGKIKDEAELLGKTKRYFQQNLKSVDALIVGSVVELERDNIEGSDREKGKTQTAHARVAIKLINPKTGEVFFNQESEGNSSKVVSETLDVDRETNINAALEKKAIDLAIVNMINEIVSALDASPSIKKQ